MTTAFLQQQLPVLKQTMALRDQLLAVLSDADLAFTPGGDALTLGELCKEMGEVQYAYTESFQTFTQDWSYRNDTPGLAASVAQLTAWFAELDAEYMKVLEGLSDADWEKSIERGGGFSPPAGVQFHVYREALLIFAGKASIYLRALGKPLPEQWVYWIG